MLHLRNRSTIGLMIMLVVALSPGTTWGQFEVGARTGKIANAKISQAGEAEKIAFDSYIAKTNGEISDMEGVASIHAITLGYDVPDFAKSGDKIWEVWMRSGISSMSGLFWIHSETGRVNALAGRWDTQMSHDRPTTYTTTKIVYTENNKSAKIEGVAMNTTAKAQSFAKLKYNQKMNKSKASDAYAQRTYAMQTSYVIQNFAARGDYFWEVRFITPDDRLNAILWINPNTYQVRYLTGPWVATGDQKTTESTAVK